MDWRCVLGRAVCLISECELNTEDISKEFYVVSFWSAAEQQGKLDACRIKQ